MLKYIIGLCFLAFTVYSYGMYDAPASPSCSSSSCSLLHENQQRSRIPKQILPDPQLLKSIFIRTQIANIFCINTQVGGANPTWTIYNRNDSAKTLSAYKTCITDGSTSWYIQHLPRRSDHLYTQLLSKLQSGWKEKKSLSPDRLLFAKQNSLTYENQLVMHLAEKYKLLTLKCALTTHIYEESHHLELSFNSNELQKITTTLGLKLRETPSCL